MGSREHSSCVDPNQGWLYSPAFPPSWRRASLYSLAQWTNGLAFREFHFSDSGKPVIKIAEIKNGLSGQTNYTRQSFDPEHAVSTGDMLFAWSGQPETSIDVYWWRGPEGWLNQHIFRVSPAPDCDAKFFYFLLKYLKPHFVAIARNKQTTGLGHVTVRDLRAMTVGVPDANTQRAIASILGALDDKIELNRRMNETLEAMARAIFKSWFVDFDPVRRNIARRQGDPLPASAARFADLDALFPDAFQDSPLGEIPKGWEVGTVGDIGENPRRTVKPQDVAEGTPYIGLEHMPKRCISLSEWGRAESVSSGKSRFDRGDILFGKLRPYFHKVGVAPVNGVCSTDILVITPMTPEWFGLLLFTVSSDEFVACTDGASTGTKMPRTNWGDMATYQIALPPRRLTNHFNGSALAVVERIRANIHESASISSVRDALLPKLLSGEVRVSVGVPA